MLSIFLHKCYHYYYYYCYLHLSFLSSFFFSDFFYRSLQFCFFSCLVLSCLVLTYLILSYLILSYLIFSYLLFCSFFLSYQLDELSLALDSGRLGGVRTNTNSFEQTSTSFSSSLNTSSFDKTTAEHSTRSKERSRRMECSIPAKKDSFLLALINILEEDVYRLIGTIKYHILIV